MKSVGIWYVVLIAALFLVIGYFGGRAHQKAQLKKETENNSLENGSDAKTS